MKIEKEQFDKEWVREQWRHYMSEKQNGEVIRVVDFAHKCIEKVKKIANE